MKKFLTLILLISTIINTYAQVGINTEKPNENALLHISEINNNSDNVNLKGIIIPRLTEAERDQLTYENPLTNPRVLKLYASDNSLMIYNTTEDCYNYWNYIEQEWKSLCGKLGKATFTFDCPSDISVFGTYIEGKETTASNYLSFKINVIKPGEYNISATTGNGYSFTATGTFLETGAYTVKALAQGTPINIGIDYLTINANGVEVNCDPKKQVEVLTAAATYTLSCKSAIVKGVYKKAVTLNETNTIILTVNVTNLGSYDITSNSVDGISFNSSGTFTSTGNQTITLHGIGTPTSTEPKELTISTNSADGSATCNVKVIITIPKKRILSIGSSENSYGYNFSGTAASGRLITSPTNFGILENSVVKFEGYERINGTNSPSTTQLKEWLINNPVDIVVLGFSWTMTEVEADIFTTYLTNNGVLIAFSESDLGNRRLFRNIFNDNTITTGSVNSAGALYKLPLLTDKILNGPFGDIRGKMWGEDASSTSYASGLPNNQIEVYSTDSDYSLTNPGGTTGRVTAFKHKSFHLIWVGDGGFNSNCGTSNTICPFNVDNNNFPISKPNYGKGISSTRTNVFNSTFTANAMAWAIEQAEFEGINSNQR